MKFLKILSVLTALTALLCCTGVPVLAAREEKGYTFVQAAVEMVPQNYVKLENEDDIKNMEKLIDLLEDNDDVQNVWHNWDQE